MNESISNMLESSQPPPIEFVLTILLNEISSAPTPFFLVLDDYHVIDAKPVHDMLVFLVEHLPQQMHLVIATREDPPLPVARLRARGQLNELRAADLRFSFSEAADFLRQVMALDLSDMDVANLENRTEGWIAGLQLAAVSMRGLPDTSGFIQAFTGSNRYVLDYLIEEVLQRQSVYVQSFLLRTSILDRMCGPLCDAVLLNPSASGQETLEYLERTNLFIVPLDTERRWFRYHHLFAELLRQRFSQSIALHAKVKTPEQVIPEELPEYDLIGFGAGIDSGRHYKPLLDLADRLPAVDRKAGFIFSTSAVQGEAKVKNDHSLLRRKLESKGYGIIGEFSCKGFNTNSFLKYFGGMNKDRPNSEDLRSAREFALNHSIT